MPSPHHLVLCGVGSVLLAPFLLLAGLFWSGEAPWEGFASAAAAGLILGLLSIYAGRHRARTLESMRRPAPRPERSQESAPSPLRVQDMRALLRCAPEGLTLEDILQSSGSPRAEIVLLLKSLKESGELSEELDLDSGEWNYGLNTGR